jgi:hypothetical protein
MKEQSLLEIVLEDVKNYRPAPGQETSVPIVFSATSEMRNAFSVYFPKSAESSVTNDIDTLVGKIPQEKFGYVNRSREYDLQNVRVLVYAAQQPSKLARLLSYNLPDTYDVSLMAGKKSLTAPSAAPTATQTPAVAPGTQIPKPSNLKRLGFGMTAAGGFFGAATFGKLLSSWTEITFRRPDFLHYDSNTLMFGWPLAGLWAAELTAAGAALYSTYQLVKPYLPKRKR